MKLFILEIIGDIWFDTYSKVLVRAESEEQAREIAFNETKIYQKDDFLKPDVSACTELKIEGNVEFIFGSFKSG